LEAQFKPHNLTNYSELTIAELFLQDSKNSLTSDEVRLLASYITRPFTLCEIVEVNPGVGMTQFDLLRCVGYDVMERSASRSLKRGEIIFCATAKLGGINFNFAMSPFALLPTAKPEILNLRKWILEQTKRKTIGTDDLREFADDVRGLYLGILSDMFAPPQLGTTDGDPWVPHKIHFELASADKAFHQLKGLAEGASENDLLADAVLENGFVTKVQIPWLGGKEEARTRLGGLVLLGLLKIDGNRLIAEVNSVSRAELLKKLVDDRCEDNATHKATLIEPIDSAVQEMWNAAAAGSSADSLGIDVKTSFRAEDSEPVTGDWTGEDNELGAVMQAMLKRHWETWLDLPVPALNDVTPREAAGSEEGRELLESLLLHYEHVSVLDQESRPYIAQLRSKLGLE
jgi:hypothetical protein